MGGRQKIDFYYEYRKRKRKRNRVGVWVLEERERGEKVGWLVGKKFVPVSCRVSFFLRHARTHARAVIPRLECRIVVVAVAVANFLSFFSFFYSSSSFLPSFSFWGGRKLARLPGR